MGIPDWIFSWSAFDLLLHFYFNNHTFQWKFSTWFFVISASPACCLALWFLWITWLNLMHEFDRHLAEWIWRKGLREVLGKRLPWESPAEHSAAPGQPMWAAQEWGLWIHRVSYHCLNTAHPPPPLDFVSVFLPTRQPYSDFYLSKPCPFSGSHSKCTPICDVFFPFCCPPSVGNDSPLLPWTPVSLVPFMINRAGYMISWLNAKWKLRAPCSKVIRNFSLVTAECNTKCRALLNAGTVWKYLDHYLEHSQQPGDYTGTLRGKLRGPLGRHNCLNAPSNPLPGNLLSCPPTWALQNLPAWLPTSQAPSWGLAFPSPASHWSMPTIPYPQVLPYWWH